jgi:hypothetical protein
VGGAAGDWSMELAGRSLVRFRNQMNDLNGAIAATEEGTR